MAPSWTDQSLGLPSHPVRSLPLNRLLKPGSTSAAIRAVQRTTGAMTAARQAMGCRNGFIRFSESVDCFGRWLISRNSCRRWRELLMLEFATADGDCSRLPLLLNWRRDDQPMTSPGSLPEQLCLA